jgi:hypothetical protein
MRTFAEFEQRFATEGACRAYLARLARWVSPPEKTDQNLLCPVHQPCGYIHS